ncbi:MAG: DUF4199 domain-containing protein, partial [Tannerellaceae bacterium]|nr:DUF4199 domain-containing protein [Tannerellaceae bacterium]
QLTIDNLFIPEIINCRLSIVFFSYSDKKMTENNNTILHNAMKFGVPLGIFWIFKYIFFMFASVSIIINGIYILLTPITLILTYYTTQMYKEQSGGTFSFMRAWIFGVLLYFFAALLVSIPHYIYYEYVAGPGFLTDVFEQAKRTMETLKVDPQILMRMEEMNAPTPISMTFYDILNNTFYGIIFSMPVAILNAGKKTPQSFNSNKTEDQE